MIWKGQQKKVIALYKQVTFKFSSKAGHVKSCLNMGGPSSKPKYSLTTDSELVPWGKGEKYPDKGSEIVSETKCLQSVGATALFR